MTDPTPKQTGDWVPPPDALAPTSRPNPSAPDPPTTRDDTWRRLAEMAQVRHQRRSSLKRRFAAFLAALDREVPK